MTFISGIIIFIRAKETGHYFTHCMEVTRLTCRLCRGCLSSYPAGSSPDSWWCRADYRGDTEAAIYYRISASPRPRWRICVANGFRRRMVPMRPDRASKCARCRNLTPRGTCIPKSRTARPPETL